MAHITDYRLRLSALAAAVALAIALLFAALSYGIGNSSGTDQAGGLIHAGGKTVSGTPRRR
jgi:hypothetical protein